MATIALTGATGLLGSALLPLLLERGHRLRLLVRPRPGRALPALAATTWIEGSVDDVEAIDRLLFGADAVVHAAYQQPEAAPGRTQAEQWMQANIAGSLRLLERTAGTGLRQLVYVSSLAVYGRDPHLDPLGAGRVRDEDYPLWPPEFYGAMRAAVEKFVVAAAHAYDLNTSVFRPGCVLGVRQPWSASPFAASVAEAASFGELRTAVGCYAVAVEDLARILADAVGDPQLQGRVFNVFDRWCDHTEAARILAQLLGRDIGVVCPPAREPEPPIRADRIRTRCRAFHTGAALRALLQQLLQRHA